MADPTEAKIALPAGMLVEALVPNMDIRGSLTEIHRDEWIGRPLILQWDSIQSNANVLRGLHAHADRYEIYILVRGRAFIGVRDVRRRSPTEGMLVGLEVQGSRPRAVHIPQCLLHGMYFLEDSMLLVGFSEYYQPSDELGCNWQDSEAGITWPCNRPVLSGRDAALPSLKVLLQTHDLAYKTAS